MSGSGNYTQTPNLGLYKPGFASDYGQWGYHLNANADVLDAAIQQNAASPSATPPANPINGRLWWDSAGGQLYVYYNDGNSSQWVVANNASGLADAPSDGNAYARQSASWVHALPLSGGTMAGALTLAADPASNLQAATKQYVDAHSGTGGGSGYLPLSGGALTGPLTLAADPTAALGASTKQYVDGAVTRAGGPFLPLAGGHLTGTLTAASGGSSHPTLENLPTLDFLGGNITFQRQITNATGPEVGANPKVIVNLDNYASNYVLQPWGGYDGPTAMLVSGQSHPGSNGTVFGLTSRIISQGNNPYGSQDTAHFVSVIKTGQNSCWGIAIQHQDNTGLAPQAFATMGIENAALFNGPEPDAHVQYDCTYSMRQLMSFIPSPNNINTWAASTLWSVGTIVMGTPSGGVRTCYIAQNTGTTGTTVPVWPTSGTVVDGGITWQTGTAYAAELGVGIMMGGGRPQIADTLIWTGIGFNATFGNACIDTTLAGMSSTNAAAIRISPGQVIDFSGGGSSANRNLRTLGYNTTAGAVSLSTPGGIVSEWRDDGTFLAPYKVQMAGNNNNSGVTTGYSDTHLTICRNVAGLGAINFVTAAANFITFYNTNGSGVIAAPYATLGAAGLSIGANQVVGPRISGWGTSTGGTRAPITAGSATLAQVAAGLAQLLADLKTHGLVGA